MEKDSSEIEVNLPGDGEHGADVGDASALLPHLGGLKKFLRLGRHNRIFLSLTHHHCICPVQEQLGRRKLTGS